MADRKGDKIIIPFKEFPDHVYEMFHIHADRGEEEMRESGRWPKEYK